MVRALFLKDKTDPVSPSDLIGAFRVRFPQFASNEQHDTQEVILHLIDVFEQSLGKEFIQDIFNGEDAQETLYTDGMSTIKTSFTTLILDVSEPCRLEDLLEDRKEPVPIEGYVDANGKTQETAAVRHNVTRWPKIVSFTFAMYDYKFPIEIPSEFMGRKLFACVIHHGMKHGGHYALLVKRYDKWFIKDDDTVQELQGIPNFRGAFYQAWFRF